ncbi:hypothetical protein DNTS_004958, partial [Danionella cerebrum]
PPSPELKVTPDGVVFTGERVELKCEIQSNLSGWRYEWSRGNSVIQSSGGFSVDGNTLTIAAADVTDGGQYWCRVFITGRSVSSRSNSVSLSVHSPPKLKVTPDRVVFTGERVELKCEIQSDLSGWRYEWSRGNGYIVIRSSYGFSVNGDTLTIANIAGSDEGVKPKPDLRSDSSAALTGNTVTLTCSMDPITGWDFYWYKTSQSSEIKKIEKKNSYLLEIDSESAGGQFWCRAGRGKPVFYSEFSNLLQINVSMSPKPVVMVRPAERVFGGEEVSLRCDVEWGGDTEWTYSWRTEGTNQNNQFKTTVSKTSNQELNFSRVDQSHSGKYFCTGHTGSQRSQSSEAVPLTVIPGEAQAALRVSPGPWLTEGDSVTLNCEVPDSSTGWRFSWFRDADLLSDSSRGAGGSYKLSPASLQHTGVYICRAQRGGAAYYTQNSSMELVWVSDAASSPGSLVVSPSRGQHFSFHSLSLSCDSSGWTVMRYTSSNPEDCSSQSGSLCGISSLQESDSGVYWCQSDSGEKHSPLNITVTQEDVILESPAGPVTEGETLTLLCSHRSRSSSILSAAFYKDGSLIQNQTTGEMSIAAVSESDEGFYSCRTEGGASPRSWISVRGAEGHFSLLKIITSLTTSSPFLLSTFVLLYKCHRARAPPFPELKVTPDRVVFTGERVELKCEIQSDLSGWRYVWRRGNSVIQLFGRFSVNGDTLTIERVTESDQGKYRCWGTTTEGASSGSSSVFLSVKAPPSPELKVTPDRVVFTGERVELKCEIQSDLMSWRYEWRRGNSVIQSSGGFSVDGNTLTIAAADVTDGGQYWCRVFITGRSVSSPSNSVSLSVYAPPELKVTPDRVVFTGERVELKCEIQSDLMSWRYEWSRGNDYSVIQSSHRFSVNGDTLTIAKVAGSDEAPPFPELKVTPDRVVFTGERVELKCETQSDLSGWRYFWSRGNIYSVIRSSGGFSVDGNTLTIAAADVTNGGQYWCRVFIAGRLVSSPSNSVSLSVHGLKPKPDLRSDSSAALTGDTVTLTCSMAPITGWDFYWYKTSQSPESKKIEKKNSYRFEIDSESAGGQFWCRTGRGKPVFYSEFSNLLQINVSVSPKPVVMVRPAERVFGGEEVSLRCDVEWGGDNDWRTEGTNQNNQFKTTVNKTSNQELNISRVDQSHSGKYFCTGHTGSQRSQSSEAVPLTVIPGEARAALRVSPGPWLTEGDSVTLNCEVPDSSTSWRFSWFRDADLLSDSSRGAGGSYKLSPASLQHTGVYICRAQRGGAAYYTQNSSMELVWVSDAASSPVSLVVSPSRGQHFVFDSLSLSCDSSGWTVRRYTSSNPEDCSSQSGSSCGISSLQESDSGVYWCQSDSGEKGSPLNITVTQEDVILESPAGPVTEGETLTLLCSHRSRSSSILSAAFYKDGSLIQNQTTGEMSIAAVSESDEGFYSCRTEGGASPRSWISVRGAEGHFSLLKIITSLTTSSPFLLSTFVLLYKCHRARVTSAADQRHLAITSAGERHYRVSPQKIQKLYFCFSTAPPFPELKVTPDRVVFTGERVELKCEIQSDLSGWRYEWSRVNGVIQSSGRFSVNGNTLTIEKVAGSDQGLYWCWGTTTEGASSGSSSVFLSVKAPPSPELKVTPDRVVFTGERVELKCEIQSDLTSWRYEWSRRNSVIQSSGGFSVDGNTLTIAAAAVTDGGQYWCRVFIAGRSVSSPSNSVSLSVHAPPSPELKVTPDRVVFTGERVQLKCEIQSDLSGWRYEWSRRNSVIQSSADVTDGDQYWCRVFIAGRLVSSPSNSVSLSVHAPPKLKVTPDGVVFTGERVELKCEIQPDLSGWRYEWSRGNIYSVIQSSHLFSVNGNTLTFANITGSDKGRYWCRRQQQDLSFSPLFLADGDMSGGEKTWSSALHLEVNGVKPKPDLRSDSSAALTGNTVTLTCSMDPITGWDFYWYKTSQSSEIKKIEKNNSYLLEIDSESAGGQFWCRAGRGKPVFYSEFSNLLQINVSVSPKAVVTVRPAERVFGGEAVSLRCDVKGGGDTEWMYSWRTEGTNHNKQFKTTVSKTSNQELNISRVDQSHSGKYFCTGHTGSQRSQSSEAVPLTVIPGEARAALRVSPGPWLTEGDSVTLNCEVPDSSTGWRFSWFRDADLLSDSSRGAGGSYKLSPASLQHTGVYICRAQRGGAAYYTQNSSMELVWVSDAASSPVSLVVNPSRGQHFSFHSLSLSCDSSGWTVRRYTSSNPEDCSSQSGSSCGISSLQESDSGVYWCQSDSGEKGSPLNITVTQEDVILDSPAGPVTEGKTLTLLCSHRSRSSSILSAAFYKDGSLIQNQTTGEMSIAAVSESDEGFYSCRTEGGASPRSWISVRASSSHLLVIAVAVGSSVFLLLIVLVLLLLRHKNKGLQRGIQQIPGPNSSGDPHQQNIPLQSEDEARANPWDNVMYSEIRKKIDMDTAGASDVVYAQITAKNTKTNKKQVYKGESTR